MRKLAAVFCLLLVFVVTGNALKCYTCEGKCDKTTETECKAAAGEAGADAAATSEAPTAAARFVQRQAAAFKCVTAKGKKADKSDLTIKGCSVKGDCAEFKDKFDADSMKCDQCDKDLCNGSVYMKPLALSHIAAVILATIFMSY